MFSAKHLQVGKVGELIALDYLKNKNYKLITTNYRSPYGEIDIIMKDPDQTLIFIEVKTLKNNFRKQINFAGLSPEDNLTSSKITKLKKICEKFANDNPQLIKEKRGWRIDLLSVTSLDFPSLTNYKKDCVINHYRNIA